MVPGPECNVVVPVQSGETNDLEYDAAMRILRSVHVDRETGCWVASLGGGSRYSTVRLGDTRKKSHRVIYCTFNGLSLSVFDGIDRVVDHVKARGCKGGHCVNPAHLELVTQRENVVRGESGAAKNAKKTHCPNGHLLAGANLRPSGSQFGYRRCLVCTRARGAVNRAIKFNKPPLTMLEAISLELSRTDGGRDLVAKDALS